MAQGHLHKAVVGAVAVIGLAAACSGALAAGETPDWDQTANIKDGSNITADMAGDEQRTIHGVGLPDGP